MMSATAEEAPRTPREFPRAKLYGWLAGAAMMLFGGLLCSVPIGLLLGVPAVLLGMYLTITFGLSMSVVPVRTPTVLALFVAGLAMVISGPVVAPLGWIAQSINEGRTLVRAPGILNALGIPMLLIGTSMITLAVQWLRPARAMGRVRGASSLALIYLGALVLLGGALFTTGERSMRAQPLWTWLAVPLALGLGAGLRAGPRGRLWLIILALSAPALPLIWVLLIARSGVGP